uniref:Uncharacterized protein n=1 Tax=Solanum tuberosum TaxID=4113 RepID=M1CQT6_SOLTU
MIQNDRREGKRKSKGRCTSFGAANRADKLKNSDFTTNGASPDSDKIRRIRMRKSLSFRALNVCFL